MREPGPTDSPGGPSQRRSNVTSTPLGAHESHPVDYITEKTACELHVGVRNLSMKAADGYALPSEGGKGPMKSNPQQSNDSITRE